MASTTSEIVCRGVERPTCKMNFARFSRTIGRICRDQCVQWGLTVAWQNVHTVAGARCLFPHSIDAKMQRNINYATHDLHTCFCTGEWEQAAAF